jgi:VWFA-related protein
MRPKTLRLVFCVALALALVALPAGTGALGQQSGQQPPSKPPAQEKQKADEQYTLAVEVPLVQVDVVVTDNQGNYLTELKKENFRVLEDGVPQVISNFGATDAPITIVMLLEFSRFAYQYFNYQGPYMGQYFLPNLKQQDWVALVTFDMKPRIEVDFTRNKNEVAQVLRRLYVPTFSETNLFDALLDTLDRLQDVKGKKSILVLASGFDSFSKRTLDETMKRLRQTEVTIFAVGLGRYMFERLDAYGAYSGPWGGADRSAYYQAENQLRAFAQMSGGRAWFPRFEGEWPSIFKDVADSLRSQYSIVYSPTNRRQDGKLRKIKVELVAADGAPLTIINQKGKQVKFVVYAREGYVPPKGGIGD